MALAVDCPTNVQMPLGLAELLEADDQGVQTTRPGLNILLVEEHVVNQRLATAILDVGITKWWWQVMAR